MKRFKAFEAYTKLSEFTGLQHAASHFYPFEIVDYRRDPHIDGVYLLFIKFATRSSEDDKPAEMDSTFSPRRTADRKERSKFLKVPNLGYVGQYGLCIYNTISQEFVEEPAILDEYDTNLEKLKKSYNFKPDDN